ncbi:hypothetical protein SLS58_010721 [Diplodia intermedia]|uniref:Uncharacterized protein n=1 Tax=Diplodia intermedia TaxID=856260 RepID=A0ABR3T3W4_9PEZI
MQSTKPNDSEAPAATGPSDFEATICKILNGLTMQIMSIPWAEALEEETVEEWARLISLHTAPALKELLSSPKPTLGGNEGMRFIWLHHWFTIVQIPDIPVWDDEIKRQHKIIAYLAECVFAIWLGAFNNRCHQGGQQVTMFANICLNQSIKQRPWF